MVKRKTNKIKKFTPLLISISILFMSIGYAIINSIELGVDGEITAKEIDGIYILETNYIESSNSQENATITNSHQTMLSSNITLEPNLETSSVSINLIFYNNTNIEYQLSSIVYDESNIDAYSNNNIQYSITPTLGTTINSKDILEVTITFSYIENADYTKNTLSSILLFEFNSTISNDIINFTQALQSSNSDVVLNGTDYTINNDGSINFTRNTTTISNIVVSTPYTDFSSGVTVALDFYTDGTSPSNDSTSQHYQLLFMSRISRELGITAWYADNKIVLDSGGNQYRTNHTLQNAGRYIILITYGKTINGVTIINKTTNQVVQTIKPNYNLTNINEGMKEVDYEVQLGADLNMTNNMSYQTTDGFKFYNFYISNEGTTEDEYIEILNNLGYTNAIDCSALK